RAGRGTGRAPQAHRPGRGGHQPGNRRRSDEVHGDGVKIERVALVTGGTRGIGHAIATALTGAGAKVALCGRDGAKGEAAAAAMGGGVKGYGCDVADAAQVERLLESVEQDLGPVDVLVNNAGITKDNLLFRIGTDDWDAVVDTNLKAAFLLTK